MIIHKTAERGCGEIDSSKQKGQMWAYISPAAWNCPKINPERDTSVEVQGFAKAWILQRYLLLKCQGLKSVLTDSPFVVCGERLGLNLFGMQRPDCHLAASPWKRAGAWGRLPEGLVFCGAGWLWVRTGFSALVCFLEAAARLESAAVLESLVLLESLPVWNLGPSGIRALSWPLRLPGIPFSLGAISKIFMG